jgi:hypothetical protein
MRAILASSWAMLQRHPEGVAHWLQRNYRARAVRGPSADATHGT